MRNLVPYDVAVHAAEGKWHGRSQGAALVVDAAGSTALASPFSMIPKMRLPGPDPRNASFKPSGAHE